MLDIRIVLLSVVLIICFFTRKYPIGGWLMFYFISMTLSILIWTAITIPSLPFLNVSQWTDRGRYLIFLFTALPNDLFFLAQFTVSMMLISRRFRDGRYVDILRIILLSQVVFTLITFPVHMIYIRESAYLDLLGMVAPSVWLLYFTFSRRVRSVYREKKTI
jgi:hypothetical protein